MLETDELLRPEEDESTKWRLKSLILEGEMPPILEDSLQRLTFWVDRSRI